MAALRSVLGDLEPGSVHGSVAACMHLAPDWRPITDRDQDAGLPSEARLAKARTAGNHLADVVSSIGASGIGLIIDATPPGAGRDPMRLHDVAASTGVAIVAATGAHAPPARLGRVHDRSAEHLAEWFALEICNGMAAIAGDSFRGVPILSERAIGVAGDALNDAAVRAGVIRITLASASIDRADFALVDAAGMTAGANGVATILDAPPGTDLGTVASRYEAAGGNRNRMVLAPGGRTPDGLLAAAGVGLAVVIGSPSTPAEGPLAIWLATIRALLRHGLLTNVVLTVGGAKGPDDGRAQGWEANPSPFDAICGIDAAELLKVTTTNALRIFSRHH